MLRYSRPLPIRVFLFAIDSPVLLDPCHKWQGLLAPTGEKPFRAWMIFIWEKILFYGKIDKGTNK
jgi:hypothetical protein